MNPTLGTNNTTDLPYFQAKGCIFKWLLHLALSEQAEITVRAMRRAIRVHVCELSKFFRFVFSVVDLALVLLEDGNSLFPGACNIGL